MEQKPAIQTERTPPASAPESRSPSSSGLDPGWTRPTMDTLPRPTYWPVTLALGTVLALGGIVTSYVVSLVGIGLIAIAIAGWIGELRHEHTN
jgi:hypothetical protein